MHLDHPHYTITLSHHHPIAPPSYRTRATLPARRMVTRSCPIQLTLLITLPWSLTLDWISLSITWQLTWHLLSRTNPQCLRKRLPSVAVRPRSRRDEARRVSAILSLSITRGDRCDFVHLAEHILQTVHVHTNPRLCFMVHSSGKMPVALKVVKHQAEHLLTNWQTPMPPSVVSLPTCSSPTSSVRTFVTRTPASPSVSPPCHLPCFMMSL